MNELDQLKQELKEEMKYQSKLLAKFYTDPANDWKFNNKITRRNQIYMGGKIEKPKDDNELYFGGFDKRKFIEDPYFAEVNNTQKHIRRLKIKINLLEFNEKMQNEGFSDQQFDKFLKRNDQYIEEDCEEDCDCGECR